MIDLEKMTLPNSIVVLGKDFEIQTDFQYFIIFSRMIKEKHSVDDFDFFYKDEIPLNKKHGFLELYKFAYPKKELPRVLDDDISNEILLDYETDADLIYSAFFHYYNIDLFQKDLHLHWYKFQSLLSAIKDTKLNDIMDIRGYKPSKNDSPQYKSQMNKLKEMWKIETPLTDEEKQEIEKFEKLASGKN